MSAFGEEENCRISCLAERWFDGISGMPPRGGASMVTTPELIVIFGGANREMEHFNDVWVYRKRTSSTSKKKPKWTKMECSGDVPPPRSGQAVCQYDGFIFLFGGFDVSNEASFNDLYTLSTDTWEWNYVGEAGDNIAPRNSHSLQVISVPPVDTKNSENADEEFEPINYLVLFGGSSPELGPLGDTYYAKLPSKGISRFYVTWISLPCGLSPSPCPREMHCTAVLPGGHGVLIGGGRSVDAVLSDVWILSPKNPKDSSKEQKPSMTTQKSTAPGIESEISSSNSTTTETEHIASMSHPLAWKRINALELPHPRCAHTAVTCCDNIVVFGGFTGQGISEDLIIAQDVSKSLDDTHTASAAAWKCLETSRPIEGRFAHSMAHVNLGLVKKEDCSEGGILIFGGIDASKDFSDVWLLSSIASRNGL